MKDFVGRRRFGEVELNRTSLYWGLLLICILSALVLVCRSHESITFHHSWFKTRRISEFRLSAWRCHVVWTQVLFSSYFFNWAAIPSIFFELHKSVQFPRRSSRWLGRQEPHRGSRRWKKIEFASLCRTIHIAQQAWRLNAVGHVNFINFLCIGFRQRKVGWVLISNPTRNRLNRRELTIWDVKWYDLNSELTTLTYIYILTYVNPIFSTHLGSWSRTFSVLLEAPRRSRAVCGDFLMGGFPSNGHFGCPYHVTVICVDMKTIENIYVFSIVFFKHITWATSRLTDLLETSRSQGATGCQRIPSCTPSIRSDGQRREMSPKSPKHGSFSIAIGSMYGIYGNIYHQYTPNVSICTIHGSYEIYKYHCINDTPQILFGWHWELRTIAFPARNHPKAFKAFMMAKWTCQTRNPKRWTIKRVTKV